METFEVCGARKGTLICLKEKHLGRHLFRPQPHVPPERLWEPIESVDIDTGLVRTPVDTIRVGNYVGIDGKKGDWVVTAIEQHSGSGDVNVAVVSQRGGQSRVFRLEKIRWRRRKKA